VNAEKLVNFFEVFQDVTTGLYGVRDKQTYRILLKPEYSKFDVIVKKGRAEIHYQAKNRSGITSFELVDAVKRFEESIKNEKYSIFKEVISGRYGIYDNKEERIAMLPIAKKAYIENGEFKFNLDNNTSVAIKSTILNDRNSYSFLNMSYQLAFGIKKNRETIIEVLNSYTEPNYKIIDSKTGHEVSKNKKILSVDKIDDDKVKYTYIKVDKIDR